MKKEEFILKVSATADCPVETTETVYNAFVENLRDALAKGETVDLVPEFAVFKAKLNDNVGLIKGSPRTPKKAKYTVRFHACKGFEQELNRNVESSNTSD